MSRLILLAAAIAEHEQRRVRREQLRLAAAILGVHVRMDDGRRITVFPYIDQRGRIISEKTGAETEPSCKACQRHGTCIRHAPWSAKPARDPRWWVANVTALEAVAERRPREGWMHEVTHHYQPIDVKWSSLPAALHHALWSLAAALDEPRVLGEEHYRPDGRSIEHHLGVVNRVYKRWDRGRATEREAIDVVTRVTAFIRSAPQPTPAPDVTMRMLTDAERAYVREHVPAKLLDPVCRQLEARPASGSVATRVARARGRAEWRERQRRRFEEVGEPPRIALGGRAAAEEAAA